MPITLDGTLGITTPALTTGSFINTGAESIGGNLTFTSTGSRILGDFTNATVTNRLAFQTSTTNSSTGIYALPNGTSTAASWQATNAADPTNASKILIATNGSTDVQLVSGINGTGTYLPLTFYTNGAEKMRLDTSGNLGIGTSSPAVKTEIYGTAATTALALRITNTATDGYSTLQLGDGNGVLFRNGSAQSGYAGASSLNLGTIGANNLGFVTNNNLRATIDASGTMFFNTTSQQAGTSKFNIACGTGSNGIGIGGATTAAAGISVNTNVTSGYYCYWLYNGTNSGSISFNGTGTTYATSSDYRLKNITGNLTGYKERILALQPKQGTWKADGSIFKGFLAHEFANQYPSAVNGEKDAVGADGKPQYQGMQAGNAETIADLVALVQDLTKEVDSLKQQLSSK